MTNNEHNNRELPGHEYDGIRELDNPAPLWWQAVFMATIVFSVFYFTYYHVADGKSLQQELAADLTALRVAQLTQEASGGVDQSRLLAMVKDPKALELGKAVFKGKCASCHGDQGQGLVGPNLTDSSWIHGDGKPLSIFKTIKEGVAEKGMPPWGAMLTPDELMQVTAYVRSIRGSTPPNPKAPQGSEQPE